MSQQNGRMTAMQVLYRYFGPKQDQTREQFGAEVVALTKEERRESAEAAANQLGVELEVGS